MRRMWCAALALLLAGCGVRPAGVTGTDRAPTGLTPGVTLYFVDPHQRLQPQLRATGRLGTIAEALALLLTGPGDTDLHTEITSNGVTRVGVDTPQGLIRLVVPLASYEVTPLGIDQLVCTALGVWVQGGGSRTTRVQVSFTLRTPESNKRRVCPLIS